MEYQFIIKVNPISKEVHFENPDELTFLEVMGMLGVVQLMLGEEFNNA